MDTVFANIDEIYVVNAKFLSALTRRIDESKQQLALADQQQSFSLSPPIGDLFLAHVCEILINFLFKKNFLFFVSFLYRKLPRMQIYGKFVSVKRADHEAVYEKMKMSQEFNSAINVSLKY